MVFVFAFLFVTDLCCLRKDTKDQDDISNMNPIAKNLCSNCSNYTYNNSKIPHYGDVIMRTIVSRITSLTIVYSTVFSGADQRKYQSSASLAFVRGIHRGPVNSPHKGPVTRKVFPFDYVIMHYCMRDSISSQGWYTWHHLKHWYVYWSHITMKWALFITTACLVISDANPQ